MNWVVGSSPEVVLGSSGKTTAGNPPRLCKQNFAKNFIRISHLPGALTTAKKSLANLHQGQVRASKYSNLKHLAKDYMEAKTRLVNKLLEMGAGRWVEKPVEQDEFFMDQ